EVTQINEIVHDAVGDEAEIIFGHGLDPEMQGEIRVTVIATGFDRAVTGQPVVSKSAASGQGHTAAARTATEVPGVLPFPSQRRASTQPTPVQPNPSRPPARPVGPGEVSDLEIPTFIRRQMD
ncbi:MAG TPA: cell division protein FtsZ, partial [Gemmatimonadales bacterium]|nr:cell division protein FtsZ [Gemmatimonadales bacterium]